MYWIETKARSILKIISKTFIYFYIDLLRHMYYVVPLPFAIFETASCLHTPRTCLNGFHGFPENLSSTHWKNIGEIDINGNSKVQDQVSSVCVVVVAAYPGQAVPISAGSAETWGQTVSLWKTASFRLVNSGRFSSIVAFSHSKWEQLFQRLILLKNLVIHDAFPIAIDIHPQLFFGCQLDFHFPQTSKWFPYLYILKCLTTLFCSGRNKWQSEFRNPGEYGVCHRISQSGWTNFYQVCSDVSSWWKTTRLSLIAIFNRSIWKRYLSAFNARFYRRSW